jgi:hypothetical protein
MQRDKFVNEAVFAAYTLMQDAADFADLEHERMEKVRNSLGASPGLRRGGRDSCCGGAFPSTFGPLSRLQPVVGFRGPGSDDQLHPLPVMYVMWRVRDRFFPTLEIVEIPLAEFVSEDKITERNIIETAASGLRYVRCLHDLPVESALRTRPGEGSTILMSELLTDARKSVAIEVLDKNPLFPFVYFSSFDFKPLNDHRLDLFQQEGEKSLLALGWELHQNRVVCFEKTSGISSFHLKAYAVQRKTLSLF